jgi:predicted dehydrogenase
MIRIGVIGYGYWGPNLVRNFAELSGCSIAMTSDLHPERLALVESRYPHIVVTTDSAELIDSPCAGGETADQYFRTSASPD